MRRSWSWLLLLGLGAVLGVLAWPRLAVEAGEREHRHGDLGCHPVENEHPDYGSG